MNSPPKKRKPGQLASKTGRKRIVAPYHTLHLLQAPFGFVFWKIEQRKARLQDRIDNQEAEPLARV